MENNPTKLDNGERKERPIRLTWILLGLSGLFLVFTLLLAVLKAPASPWLPVHIHSVLAADYSQDPRGRTVAQVRFSVIRDLLADLAGKGERTATAKPDERYTNVIDDLQTSVPTVTPMPGATVYVPTARPGASPTPPLPTERLATATSTDQPSATLTSMPAETATIPPSATPTPTIVFVYPTATRRPPTQPPAPTRTHPPAATSTSAPSPTQPPTPVPTATPRPTQPPPPTAKPTKPPYPPPYP